MRYKTAVYAKAFLSALEMKGVHKDELPRRFLEVLRRHGAIREAPRIIDEIERMIITRSGGRNVRVEIARSLEKKKIQEIMDAFRPEDKVRVRINPALVAGAKIVIDGAWAVDTSLQGRLEKLFPGARRSH